jgi:hypothetical protein
MNPSVPRTPTTPGAYWKSVSILWDKCTRLECEKLDVAIVYTRPVVRANQAAIPFRTPTQFIEKCWVMKSNVDDWNDESVQNKYTVMFANRRSSSGPIQSPMLSRSGGITSLIEGGTRYKGMTPSTKSDRVYKSNARPRSGDMYRIPSTPDSRRRYRDTEPSIGMEQSWPVHDGRQMQ